MGTKKSFADIVRETEGDLRQRLQAKVPDWTDVLQELRLPARLNVEQCSSAAAARYKAALAASLLEGSGHIADLTGGLGVDAWAFSAEAEAVLYNEMDPALCEAVQANFALLGIRNAVFSNAEVRPGMLREILGGFRPDLIYLDPARRSDTGRKVFRLEDCRPDLLALQEELLALAPHLLVKLSPMADLSLLLRQLKGVSAIHIVSLDGECKELLVLAGRRKTKDISLVVTEIRKGQTASLSFPEASRELRCKGLESPIELAGNWLFEPGASLNKSGCQDTACQRAGLRKFAPSTHLYLASAPVPELVPFGRFRRIVEVLPLDKRSIRETTLRFPQADVTARNIPLRSDELARRLGVRSGGPHHIYGAALSSGHNYLIITES